MKTLKSFFALVIFASIAMSPVARSQSAQPAKPAAAKAAKGADAVEIKLDRKKISVVNGKETLVAADAAKPGETLVETAVYTNRSAAAVTKVEATLPIPSNTVFVAGSVLPTGAKASTDGKSFDAIPLVRKVVGKNGVVTEQPVPLADYRFLRWTIGALAPGQSSTVSAKVRVSTDAPA